MSYEGQIAGLGDNQPGSPLKRAALRAMQRFSGLELADRRAAAIAAVETVAPLEFVNGGGTAGANPSSRRTEAARRSGATSPKYRLQGT
ncbi:hypothetical protein ACFYO0_04175 [Streptomyces sp. NPDC006365]|uniref:hypothetical protein n=1 Tax=Streptomyces sp. NPDC006365 TaxID=3364744 RepID=UPI0036A066CD